MHELSYCHMSPLKRAEVAVNVEEVLGLQNREFLFERARDGRVFVLEGYTIYRIDMRACEVGVHLEDPDAETIFMNLVM